MIKKLLKVGHLQGHLVCLYLNLHHYIITNACLSVHSNIYIKKTVSEKNNISIFPKSEHNLHLEGMPNLGKFLRDPRESPKITMCQEKDSGKNGSKNHESSANNFVHVYKTRKYV